MLLTQLWMFLTNSNNQLLMKELNLTLGTMTLRTNSPKELVNSPQSETPTEVFMMLLLPTESLLKPKLLILLFILLGLTTDSQKLLLWYKNFMTKDVMPLLYLSPDAENIWKP